MGGAPVLFVHGLWLHSDSWQPWVEHFAEAGFDASAPGWPGDGATVAETREHPERVAGVGIDAVVDHYAGAIGGLPAKPVVIGHSFGGLIAQRLLGQGLAAAAVGIDAAPIKGVMFLPLSALRVASVALRNPLNRKRAVSLTSSSATDSATPSRRTPRAGRSSSPRAAATTRCRARSRRRRASSTSASHRR